MKFLFVHANFFGHRNVKLIGFEACGVTFEVFVIVTSLIVQTLVEQCLKKKERERS